MTHNTAFATMTSNITPVAIEVKAMELAIKKFLAEAWFNFKLCSGCNAL